jgi:hypothetical protein
MGDRLNCGSSESRGTRAVAPKSERETVNLGRRLLSSELYVSITRALCRSRILLNIVICVDGYEVGRFGELIHDQPNQIKLAGHQR